MDEWNDFGVAPVVPPGDHVTHQARRDLDSSSQGSFASLLESQGGEEPASVMFTIPERASDARPISRSGDGLSTGESYEPGDLDDDTDFEEIGLSSSGVTPTSESDRYHKKSYTKLEVISAMQIKKLVHVFHVVVGVAACWTLFSIIICNTMFLDVQPIVVRPILLTQAGRAESRKVMNARTSPSARYGVPDAQHRANQRAAHALLSDSLVTRTVISTPQTTGTIENVAEEAFRRCYYFCKDIDIAFNEFVKVASQDCSDPSHVCYDYMKGDSDKTAAQVVRLSRDRPTGILGPDNVRFEVSVSRVSILESWYRFLVHLVIFICGTTSFLLGILFLIRVTKVGRKNLSQEQIFAVCLLFVTFLYLNVPLSVMQGHSALGKTSRKPFPEWFNQLEAPFRVLRDISFGPFMVFYLWANIHSYRILDPAQKLGASFYLPKLALLVPYAFLKVSALYTVNFLFSEVPFISAVVLVHTFGKFRIWAAFRPHMIYLIVVTLLEMVLLGLIIWETVRTLRVLRRAPYMRHRAKQIGFRYFLYISLVYFSAFFILQLLLVVGRPKGEILGLPGISTDLFLTIPWSHTTGTVVLTFGYAVISAYVNLPYDSVGAVKGWFKGSDLAPASSQWSVTSSSSEASFSGSEHGAGSAAVSGSLGSSSQSDRRHREHQPSFIVDKDYELNQEIVEPITYRKRESEDSLELKANCFTMQTHVIMFNFAWYVYYYGTPKFDNLKPQESVLPFRFTVAESISEPATDTHALVIDGLDRIVVTFKGTTSMRNLQTSMKIYHERLINVVPTDLDGVDELERLRIIFGRSYEAAKIHKGFAAAYSSVAQRVMLRIKSLIEERPRPVFLTGHSLGGALATICSLDVWIKLRISRRQIFVSTFGSPRVGNEAFRRIYNSVIALHWRIVVDPDMVAKLPKVGYRHVGKKVLLTPHGEMFIDPNALELKLWSGNTAGFAYHRKASYLLAMRAWCVRHHKMSYTPAFWPFPVREEDYQRFEGANVEEEQEEIPGNKLAEKIIRMDAMVDSLDDGIYGNMAAIEKWARLTRRLLLNNKLKGAMNQ